MKNYTPREIRSAVMLAVLVTAIVVLALVDPSCRRNVDPPREGPSRAITPN